MSDLIQKRCKPCEGGVAPYDAAQAQEMLKQIPRPVAGRARGSRPGCTPHQFPAPDAWRLRPAPGGRAGSRVRPRDAVHLRVRHTGPGPRPVGRAHLVRRLAPAGIGRHPLNMATRRGIVPGLIAMALAGGCASEITSVEPIRHASGMADAQVASSYIRIPRPDRFSVCHEHTCRVITTISLAPADWQSVRVIFTPPAKSEQQPVQ